MSLSLELMVTWLKEMVSSGERPGMPRLREMLTAALNAQMDLKNLKVDLSRVDDMRRANAQQAGQLSDELADMSKRAAHREDAIERAEKAERERDRAREDEASLAASFARLTAEHAAPVPMRLTCPTCSALHVDEGAFATKPHHTHACQSCGAVWRPAVVATVGVRFLPGFKTEAAVRTFVRIDPNPHQHDYEMCATCGKHIRLHYGFGAKSSAEYRCDPKEDMP